jgi:hypothetical protein
MSNIIQEQPPKKKRGRKKLSEKKLELEQKMQLEEKIKNETLDTEIKNELNELNEIKKIPKKRGRKPKGGKIIENPIEIKLNENVEPNIILHLKCSLNDIDYNKKINVNTLNSYEIDNKKSNNLFIHANNVDENINILKQEEDDNENDNNYDDDNKIKDIWKKINQLKINLHKNNIPDKRSACFWCTCSFDNPPIFIPKFEFNNSYHVYGCFCSPQCACAHLINEKIDTSVKFERYQLLNHVYGKIYDYNDNIKPAPNPYYLLDKYYGNLSISEYRELFKNDKLLLVVEKPLSHIFPELYEDNTDFILNQRIIPSNSNLKVRKKSTETTKNNFFNT